MKILQSYPDPLPKKLAYDLTLSPRCQKMTDAKNTVLDVAAWCVYEDEDRDGNPRTILSLRTVEGETYATNSSTFRDDYQAMVDLFGPDGITAIEVITGSSKAGREFITCAYAGE